MSTGTTIATLEWGNRTPNEFIDSAVKNAGVLDLFTLIDKVKNKVQVPIFDGVIQFGNELCVFDPQSSASIDEKEMTVTNWKWAYQNCKEALQTSYRSKMLKQGANNPETIDAMFAEWVFSFFSKKASEKMVELAATEIKAEIAGDSNVIKPTGAAGATTESNILARMQAAYKALSVDLLNQLYGGADREYRPAFFFNAKTMQYYQLAIANAYTTVYDGIAEGRIMPYLGMEVILFTTLANDEMILTNPANLVMVVDDYADVKAIQAKYEDTVSSDYLWGQWTSGFSYMKSENIIYAVDNV